MKITNDKRYMPKEYIGKEFKHGGITKNAPRRWTKEEVDWALNLKKEGYTNKEISEFIYRDETSVSIKMKRLGKKDGKKYNEAHRTDKYKYNDLFIQELKPSSVLDVYSGEVSFYKGKVKNITTNDKNKEFDCDYSEDSLKLLCKLYYENKKYDIIDLDPFGSAFDCFDLSIKMAKLGLVITFGEMGHKRWKRLDYVRRYYGINSFDDFHIDSLIAQVVKIGQRNKKELIPVFIRNYHNISRVYFKIRPLKITEQWD